MRVALSPVLCCVCKCTLPRNHKLANVDIQHNAIFVLGINAAFPERLNGIHSKLNPYTKGRFYLGHNRGVAVLASVTFRIMHCVCLVKYYSVSSGSIEMARNYMSQGDSTHQH